MAEKIERKRLNIKESKLAASETTEKMEFSGYGSIFNNVDSYGDMIAPGAFANYISDAKADKQDWPAMLLQHGGWGVTSQDLVPIGVWADMAEDDLGLKMNGTLADIQKGQDIYTLMKMTPRPAIKGLSIGYYAREIAYGGKNDSYDRLIKQIDLVEVSIVTFPANTLANVTSVKSKNDYTERDFEHLMQDAGFSRSEARDIINHGFKNFLAKQDAGKEGQNEIIALLKKTTELFNKEEK